jgi:raffinose/stachyose/melibiose transport system substrate-binding protein
MKLRTLLMLILVLLLATSTLFAGGKQEAAPEKIVLNYATWMTKGEDKPWIDAFMAENPDIEVKMEMLEGGKYQELLGTRILSGDIPDVMMIMSPQVQDYSREGYLADISGTYAAELLKTSPMATEFSTRDGKLYAFLVSGGFMGHVWYNKKLFNDLGIDVPQTMDEFWLACEKLKNAGKDAMLLGGADTWTYKMLRFASWTHFVSAAVKANGIGDIRESIYRGADVAAVYRENVEFGKKLVDNGYLVKASLTTTWPQSSQIFVDGNVGMFPQGPWVASLPEVVAADPAKFELGIFALPVEAADGKRYVLANMDRFMAVSAKSKYPEAAMKLFNFITSQEQMTTYLEGQGLTTLVDLSYKLPQEIVAYKEMVTAPNYTSVPLIFAAPADWENQESMSLKNIQSGATVDKVLADLAFYYKDNKDSIKF